MWLKLGLFLLLNFGALAIGGYFTGKGVPSEWYESLNKAPWTPPGWMFGAAWTLIMVCLAFFMAHAYNLVDRRILIALFSVQWVLNVLWNPVFFYYHHTMLGLIVIGALTCLIGVMLFLYFPMLKFKALLLLPYFIWLLIASSLNAYILVKN